MEPTDQNRKAWDALHRERADALSAAPGLSKLVQERLPELQGLHVLHLHCGTGEQTAELADLGALVTGVDASAAAIQAAHEHAPTASFVQADAHELPLQLRRGRFDLVFSSGFMPWVRELGAWTAGVTAALRPGGGALLENEHPALLSLDPVSLRWQGNYFEEVIPLGALVTSLVAAGLVLNRLDELPGAAAGRRPDPRIPGEFVLIASKPR